MSEINCIWIHALQPRFEYLSCNFIHNDAIYYPSKDIVFLATKKKPISEYGYDVYTEASLWTLEEIRLLASITLSVPEDQGQFIVFAPWYCTGLPSTPISVDLSSPKTLDLCKEFAIALHSEHQLLERDSYRLFDLDCVDTNVISALFNKLDPTNGILIRGLYCLMKSELLRKAADYFMEDVFFNLQISREAALLIIIERLRKLGKSNPNYKDAHNYIRSNFLLGEELSEYLEDQHKLWIKAKHPINRYGTQWAPGLTSDDVYETYGCLVSIYRHLILNEPGRSSLSLL